MISTKLMALTLICMMLTSCLSFNKPDSPNNSNSPTATSDPESLSINEKVNSAIQSINGEKFSIGDTKTLVIDSNSNLSKLASTNLVVLGNGKTILISGPGSIINNKKFKNNDYSFFEIKEAFNGKTRSSIINASSDNTLNYKLAL